MNYYQDEKTAEYHRQGIHAELKQIRLQQFALKSKVYKPGRSNGRCSTSPIG